MKEINETDVYSWFRKNYKALLDESYEIVSLENDKHNIPDFWLKQNNEYIPVECKLQNIDKAALRQLQRYMNVYETQRGVAVGERCVVDLPDNIIFISHDVYKNKIKTPMKVINKDRNGKEIDLTKITVPLNNPAYDICKEAFKGGINDRSSNKDSVQKE